VPMEHQEQVVQAEHQAQTGLVELQEQTEHPEQVVQVELQG